MHTPFFRLVLSVFFCLGITAQITRAHWTKVNPKSNPSAEIFDFAFGQNQWLAVGDRGLVALRNGEDWNELPPISNHPLRSVSHIGTRFIAVGDSGTILASAVGDPARWSVLASPTIINLIKIQQLDARWLILGQGGLILTASDGLNWSVLRPSDQNGPNFTDITHFSGEFLALAGKTIWRSADAITWSADPGNMMVNYPEKLKVLNGNLIAFGAIGSIARSSDGYTWTKVISPLADTYDSINDIVYVNGRYLLAGSNNLRSENRSIYSSTDLVTWNSTDGVGRKRIVTHGTTCVSAVGSAVETSPDGINWKSHKRYLSYPAIFAQGEFHTVDRNFRYTSVDGLVWTESRLPSGVSGSGIYEANGTYFVQNQGKAFISTDLQNWQAATFPNYGSASAPRQDFLYAFGKYFSIGESYLSKVIFTSTNALNWTVFTSGVSAAFGNGRLVIVNSFSNVFDIRVSTNGTSTTLYSNSGQPGASAVAFGNGLFVAVSGRVGYQIRTSVDGIAWTVPAIPATSGDFSEISFENNRFIARGKGGILTSTDGVTWEDVSYAAWEDEDTPRYSIVYGNGVWLLSGGFPLRSTDFPNWELLTDIYDHKFIRVRYLHDAFWALSQTKDNITTGSLWRSVDGLDWKLVERLPFIPSDIAISPALRTVVTSDFGQVAISDDLTHWQIVDAGLGRIAKVMHYNDRFYACTQSSLKQSNDGVSWTAVPSVPTGDFFAITSSPLGVTTLRTNGYEYTLHHSANGSSWVNSTISGISPATISGIVYSGTELVVSLSSGDLAKSVDGISWSLVSGGSNISFKEGVLTGSGVLALSNGTAFRSSSAAPFAFHPEHVVGALVSITQGDGVSVAVGNDSSIYAQSISPITTAPVGFIATVKGDRYVALSWQNASSPPAGFILEYRLAGSLAWVRFGGLLSANSTSATVTGLLPSKSYNFRIMSVEPGMTSAYQNISTPLPVTITPIREWRRFYFASEENTGSGANTADFDKDGSKNLLEYAIGSNPLIANAQSVGVGFTAGSITGYKTHYMEFWCNALNTDISYIAEYSENLLTWIKLDTSVGGQHFTKSNMIDPYYPYPDRNPYRKVKATVTTSNARGYFRLRVESNE